MASGNNISEQTYTDLERGTGWICPNCGRPNREGAKFCAGCGTHKLSAYEPDTASYRNETSYGAVPVYNAGAADAPGKKSSAGKVIIIILAILLLLALIGFGVWHFFLSGLRYDGAKAAEKSATEQTADSGKEVTAQNDSGYNPNAADPNQSSDISSAEGVNNTNHADKSGNKKETDNASTTEKADSGNSRFEVGGTYTVVTKDGVRVRSTPTTDEDNQINYSDLSDEERSQALIDPNNPNPKACIKEGGKVTCLEVKGDWIRIQSGWVCTYYEGEPLIR